MRELYHPRNNVSPHAAPPKKNGLHLLSRISFGELFHISLAHPSLPRVSLTRGRKGLPEIEEKHKVKERTPRGGVEHPEVVVEVIRGREKTIRGDGGDYTRWAQMGTRGGKEQGNPR